MSLVKLTSLSTQTLSLLLERQRLQSLPQFQSQSSSTSNLHLPQITRNLNQLRAGILELEATDPNRGGETAGLLRNQHGRMRGMVGGEGETESLGIQRYVELNTVMKCSKLHIANCPRKAWRALNPKCHIHLRHPLHTDSRSPCTRRIQTTRRLANLTTLA